MFWCIVLGVPLYESANLWVAGLSKRLEGVWVQPGGGGGGLWKGLAFFG